MTSFSRRSFLKTAGLTAAGTMLSARSWSQVPGANSDVRVAIIGLGGRGRQSHGNAYHGLSGVRIAALCDVDSARLDLAMKQVRGWGYDPKAFTDAREILARNDIDAISIATCNHWHTPLLIWACQAGKDVYVEKPLSHNIWEGRQAVRAAAKYGRVVQAGTQNRSRESVAEAVAYIRAGTLGKIKYIRGLSYKRRPTIGLTVGPQPVPATVNYDLYLGPRPMVPFRRTRIHGDWHLIWDTGNGDLGNQGVHQMDVIRWFIGGPMPAHSLSFGGRLGYVDDGQTPNTQVVVHDHPVAPIVFEVRGLPKHSGTETMDKYPDEKIGNSVGIVLHCEHGMMIVPNLGTKPHSPEAAPTVWDHDGKLVKTFKDEGIVAVEHRHFGNFIDVIRSRKMSDLKVGVEEGHQSAALCHLGNISYRLGRALPPAELRERVAGDARLSEAFGRMTEHLGKNGVNLDQRHATFGLPVSIDSATERFPGNDAANALLKDTYRAPFTFPELS